MNKARPLRAQQGHKGATLLGVVLAVVVFATGCGNDGVEEAESTVAPATEAPAGSDQTAGERCEMNRSVGEVTFVTSFDYSASANILGPIVARAEGFFEEVCLDVTIQPGFAPGNAVLVDSGVAQLGSGGSLGEIMNNNIAGTDLVVVVDYGKTAIEALVVPADSTIQEVADLVGTTMGVKGDIPYSIQLMLALEGVERSELDEVLLDGFDPVTHLNLGIDALPVYKSNEPRQLEAAGVEFRMFDPLDYNVPASFGIQFASRSFLEEHPTVVQDFVRASFRGFQFALDSPDVAVQHTVDLVQAAEGFLTFEGESFRWAQESAIVLNTTPAGDPFGLVYPDLVRAEAEALTEAGVFSELPDFESMIDPAVANELWDGVDLIWPGPAGSDSN